LGAEPGRQVSRTPSRNEALAQAFGAQFSTPIAPCSVRRINGVPQRDAWMCACYDKASGAGITAHVFGGQTIRAYVEVLGGARDIERIAKAFAETLAKLARKDGDGTAEAQAPEEAAAGQAAADGIGA
jgi:hypothetical protein